MESFILSTAELLEAFPSATVSITYANVTKKNKNPEKNGTTHTAKFKVFEAHTGKCIQYKTSRSKELSRLLTYLGPRGVLAVKRTHEDEETGNKKPKLVVGASSVMANTKFEETKPVAAVETEAPVASVAETDKKSKKKKKGKKK